MTYRILLKRGGSILVASLLLSACTSTPPQTSMAQLEQQLSERFPNAQLSAQPTLSENALDLKSAVQTMLSHSPQVRMELAELGIADAQRLQAELISNPHLSIGALRPEGGGRWELDVGLSQPLLELFTRPLRRQMAQENILTVQLKLQAELQELIAKTATAYYEAVAAQQHLQVQHKMREATLARQQLATSLYRAGNMSENSFLYYDNEARRVEQQVKKRERNAQEKTLELLNLIGLESRQKVMLPSQLPVLPVETFTQDAMLEQARKDRLDIKITQQQLAQLQQRRTYLQQENGWRDMSIGINAEREFDGQTNVGPEIELALPIFNRNQGKLASLDARNEKLNAQLQQLTLDADSEVAQALNHMQSAREQLGLIQSSLQVAQKRVILSNREVNFMLGSPFELLNIKRQEIQLAHEYTNELANYWQARTQLELAIGRELTPAKKEQPSGSHQNHDHQQMDHSKMDHGEMDHSKMDHSAHSEAVDHSAHQHENTENDDKKANEHEEHQHD